MGGWVFVEENKRIAMEEREKWVRTTYELILNKHP